MEGSKDRKLVLDDVSFSIAKGERVGILGHNGAGKSTMIRLISGIELPSRGKINRGMSVSWPVGLNGAFANSLTGNDNIRFIARIYERPIEQVTAYVQEFAELGDSISEPIKSYSSGMRARLNFALSLAIDFDCYLMDEILSVGDSRFVKRSHEELFEKKSDRALILASHDANTIRSYCSKAVILFRGRAKMFEDIQLALDIYEDLQVGDAPPTSLQVRRSEEDEEEDEISVMDF